MTKRILLLGVVLISFYEGILYLLMPSGKLPEFIDFRVTKEYIALGLALSLTVCIWQKVKKIECPNKWTLFFLMFMFFNMSKNPIAVANRVIDVSLLGNFSAEFKVFAFFLMFCSLSSVRFSDRFFKILFKTIYISGIVMAFYMILQSLNLDQILKPKPEYIVCAVTSPGIAGFCGQPTLAVPFLCLCIPFAVYFKKWIAVVVISIAAVLTQSDFAFLCLAFIGTAYLWSRKKVFIAISSLFVMAGVFLVIFQPGGFFNNNGRFGIWIQILKDVFTGEIHSVPVRIGMTGAGLNNFGEIFTALHSTPYTRAHNEPLQVLWCCGVIGLGIFLMIHFDVFKACWDGRKHPMMKPLFLSLSVLVLCSMGTFVYQLGIYQFLVVVIAALIYQINRKGLSYDAYSINSTV